PSTATAASRGSCLTSKGTHVRQRAPLAEWRAAPAELLTVLAQQLMGSDQPIEAVGAEGGDVRLDAAVRPGVAAGVWYHAQPSQHPHAVRVEPQHGVAATEQQNLLGARLADAREARQR